MQTNPVVWFEIYVQDMARAKRFYETLLQGTLEKLDTPDCLEGGMEMWAFPMDMTAAGASGALAKIDGCGSGGGTLVYFACEDCAVAAARAASAGGSVLKEKFAIGQYGHIALIHDTEGNVVGLHSMK